MISLLFKKVRGRGEGAYICYFGLVGMGGGGGGGQNMGKRKCLQFQWSI